MLRGMRKTKKSNSYLLSTFVEAKNMKILNKLKLLAASQNKKFKVTTRGHMWIVKFGSMGVEDMDLTKAMNIMLAALEPDHGL